jgi:predicted ATPase
MTCNVWIVGGVEGESELYLTSTTGADSNTLALLVALLSGSQGSTIHYLLIIGAYRDNEVNDEHPLTQALRELKGKGGFVRDLILSHLKEDDVVLLLEDSFNKNPSTAILFSFPYIPPTSTLPPLILNILY